ncbi:SGNH/GDSL hydrolase family protein [Streptomyces cinereoruber]|uniref:SGNH/GDSL hydrolase family protein n=1 Tax=Streptomyces cinereoruber TaxID=67260 RepID=UPI0036282382
MSSFPAPGLVWRRVTRRLRRAAVQAGYRIVLRNPLWDGTSVPAPRPRYLPSTFPSPTTGRSCETAALHLAVVGDSSALTVGVHRGEHTVSTVLATALADALGCPIDLTLTARAGATTTSLPRQLRTLTGTTPGVAIVQIGGNDVFAPVRLSRTAEQLACHVRDLRTAGWQVVVTACPDIGAAPAVRRFARLVGTKRSRRLAALQTAAALRAGASVVSLTAPEFRTDPDGLYCPDRFHPSPAGYRLFQQRALPAVLHAAHTHHAPGGSADLVLHADQHRCWITLSEAQRQVHHTPGATFYPHPSLNGALLVHHHPGHLIPLAAPRTSSTARTMTTTAR